MVKIRSARNQKPSAAERERKMEREREREREREVGNRSLIIRSLAVITSS